MRGTALAQIVLRARRVRFTRALEGYNLYIVCLNDVGDRLIERWEPVGETKVSETLRLDSLAAQEHACRLPEDDLYSERRHRQNSGPVESTPKSLRELAARHRFRRNTIDGPS